MKLTRDEELRLIEIGLKSLLNNSKAGSTITPKKSKAAKANGKLGGRPRKVKKTKKMTKWTPEQRRKMEVYFANRRREKFETQSKAQSNSDV